MLFCFAQAGYAESGQVPDGYYDSADQLSGKSLKVALGKIAKDHEVFAYGDLWYHYELTDVVPGTQNQVFDYYSPRVYYFTGTGTAPDGANKEHCCAQSWWGSGGICNAYSDLFNVYPSDMDANSAKSNYPLGVVGGTAKYSNACMKVGQSGRSEYSGMVFEPCDEYKGDFARMYFYVATTYADAAWGSKESVASTVPFTQEDYPTINSWLLDLLLKWNADDPVSDWEIIRNERVYSEQKNRNPFVDYPQLADYIWGDSVSYAFDLSKALVNGSASGGTSGGHQGGGEDVEPGGGGSDDDEDVNIGSLVLVEKFDGVENGNDTSTSGSASAWSGNDNFPTVESVFQAGGAIRMGSSKKVGRIVSKNLVNDEGVTLVVEVKVKGWTNIEGQLLVGITGEEGQPIYYKATMSEDYETYVVMLDNVPANASVTLETSAKRCFLTSVRVAVAGMAGSQTIGGVKKDAVKKHRRAYTLQGKRASKSHRGITVEKGNVYYKK